MNEGSITSKWERPDFRWFSNFEREWRNIDNEGKTDFRLKRVCFNIKHTCLELKIQSDSARFPSGVQPRVSSVHIQTAINHVSLVHGVNFHAEAKKTFTLSTLRWTTKLSSHSYRAHTHTHTPSRSNAEWSWTSDRSRQTSPFLFRCGSEFMRTGCASVLHSHCFGLEVFHESIFSCGREQNRVSQTTLTGRGFLGYWGKKRLPRDKVVRLKQGLWSLSWSRITTPI